MLVTAFLLLLSSLANAQHHGSDRNDPWNDCVACHGADLTGAMFGTVWAPSCFTCHNDFSYPDPPPSGHHGSDRDNPLNECATCHGAELTGAIFGAIWAPSCFICHGQLWTSQNQPPVADPNGPYSGSAGEPVLFDGSGSSDLDGTIVSYDWDFGDGGTGTGVAPTYTYAAEGTYTVSLTVTDDGGATDTATTTAIIDPTPANEPPVVDPGGPYTGISGQPVQFDASGTIDPDGDTLIYLWDFGDGTIPPFPSQDPTATHAYEFPGTYTVQLAVTDQVNELVSRIINN